MVSTQPNGQFATMRHVVLASSVSAGETTLAVAAIAWLAVVATVYVVARRRTARATAGVAARAEATGDPPLPRSGARVTAYAVGAVTSLAVLWLGAFALRAAGFGWPVAAGGAVVFLVAVCVAYSPARRL
jgi:hypothetical protein